MRPSDSLCGAVSPRCCFIYIFFCPIETSDGFLCDLVLKETGRFLVNEEFVRGGGLAIDLQAESRMLFRIWVDPRH